jgi:16S rRNA (uracil1498-N3)-methyltransferase
VNALDPRLRAGPHVFVDDLEDPELTPDDRHHLVRVLRLRDGRPLTVADGAGRWRPARWVGGAVEPAGAVEVTPEPRWAVTVAAPAVKGDRPEWMVAKLTELGVDRIVVVETARSVVRWVDDRAARHRARLERVAREAAMQSRRTRLPVVEGPVPLADLVGGAAPIALAPAEPGAPLVGAGVRAVAVGPEGGWEPAELAAMAPAVGLPGGVLRTETAAVVAGTLLVAQRDGSS